MCCRGRCRRGRGWERTKGDVWMLRAVEQSTAAEAVRTDRAV
jgi:biotin-(acetyl-CoA carboxylase) ligase